MLKFLLTLAFATFAAFVLYSQNRMNDARSYTGILDATINGFYPPLVESNTQANSSESPVLSAKGPINNSELRLNSGKKSRANSNKQEDFKQRVLSRGSTNQQMLKSGNSSSEELLSEQISEIKEKKDQSKKSVSGRPSIAMNLTVDQPEHLPNYFKKPDSPVIVIYQTTIE